MAELISPTLSPSTVATSVASDDSLTMRYTNFKDLLQIISSIPGDFLMVTDVSPTDYDEIYQERERARRKFRLRRYQADSRILIITIPTVLHEALHVPLYEAFCNTLVRRGVEDSWWTYAATTFRKRGHPGGDGGDGGEGDSTGGPDPERAALNKWPTLVIEAGVSESLGELHRDMRWWFSASNHEVKIVILVKFGDQGRSEILIERWEEDGAARPGATSTRRSALVPALRQTIRITQRTTTNPVSYNVARSALVLSFKLLFLREPTGPQEGDIIIDIPQLQRIGRKIWRFVEN